MSGPDEDATRQERLEKARSELKQHQEGLRTMMEQLRKGDLLKDSFTTYHAVRMIDEALKRLDKLQTDFDQEI